MPDHSKALPSGESRMTLEEEATARTHILGLIHRYASLAREQPTATISDQPTPPSSSYSIEPLFEAEGLIKLPDGRELSPSQLGEITRTNPPKLLRHNLTTVDIQFVAPDKAHCQSYIIAGTHLKMPDHWGRWDDVVRRQEGGDGKWLFVEKVVVVDGMDPEGWLAQTLGPQVTQ
jgi:hypothetical protein